jgi:SAM-dependent methyltransferase
MAASSFLPTRDELIAVYRQKYSRKSPVGWGPPLRLAHDYFTPDDYYEALVGKLLEDGSEWCDVGCGRDIFPTNPDLAKAYAARCSYVFGIDPDDNVRENTFVNDFFQGLVEECPITRNFDLVTLRMVAEHIADPEPAMARLASLLKPDGLLLIYTPYKWAPMSLIANATPFSWHNPLKRLIWRTEARDTFPTQYKLNTSADIEHYAASAGLEQVFFQRLDDCRITNSYRRLNTIELKARSLFRKAGFPYPEACIVSLLRLGTPGREQ